MHIWIQTILNKIKIKLKNKLKFIMISTLPPEIVNIIQEYTLGIPFEEETYKNGCKTYKKGYKSSNGSMLEGKCKTWRENGQLEEHSHYKDGKKHGEYKYWYDNGQLWVHCHYKNGKKHGECKWWHPNGQLWELLYYKNGKLHGEYKEWWGNGKLYEHSHYKDGKSHGEYKLWHENGQQWEHLYYKDDKILYNYNSDTKKHSFYIFGYKLF